MKLAIHPTGLIIDISDRDFHGYTVMHCGTVLGKKGAPLATENRDRRGGGFDVCIRLCYRGKKRKWTLSRLIASCFLGNIDGMEINHLKRDPTKNGVMDIEILTPSQNQRHWRDDNERKRLSR